MTTTLDLITKALQKIGAVTKDETLSAGDVSDALSSLNDMISSWSLDSLIVYASTLENFTLTPGSYSYTIGSGGNFNTTRPKLDLDQQILFDLVYNKGINTSGKLAKHISISRVFQMYLFLYYRLNQIEFVDQDLILVLLC